ncbi:putative ammonium transporter 3 [Caerostris extrusa]|uniref:Ammonium transporter 3 n=1 Tax=Caerostris extrusa TaxID=172846 RepID=A0AAV4MMF6_CAEEX|nr:putative ammonium transporter 3 [Caerostris extrusa]
MGEMKKYVGQKGFYPYLLVSEEKRSTEEQYVLKDILSNMMVRCNSSRAVCNTNENGQVRKITYEDATWVMTSSFIIFTMQSGFALLESGCVTRKNEVNVMMKNIVDMAFGMSYWMFGYGISYGTSKRNKSLSLRWYLELLRKDSTSLHIASIHLNTFIYCLPAGWIWGNHGFFNIWELLTCWLLSSSFGWWIIGFSSCCYGFGPRNGRYDSTKKHENINSPTNAMLGMFILWWGWLGFNCGSTFGITDSSGNTHPGQRYLFFIVSAICTINASIGGGLTSLIFSSLYFKRKFLVPSIINGILSALVAITAGCVLYHPWEALCIEASVL